MLSGCQLPLQWVWVTASAPCKFHLWHLNHRSIRGVSGHWQGFFFNWPNSWCPQLHPKLPSILHKHGPNPEPDQQRSHWSSRHWTQHPQFHEPYLLTWAGNQSIVVVTDMMSRWMEPKAVYKADLILLSATGKKRYSLIGGIKKHCWLAMGNHSLAISGSRCVTSCTYKHGLQPTTTLGWTW